MQPPTNDITQSNWLAVKTLWFAVQDAAPEAREQLLTDASVSEEVRAQVRSLLAASEELGNRFETPAIRSLGVAGPEPQEEAAPSLVGRKLGPYQVVRRIGQGGMGAVYEAVRANHDFDQRVAIKTIWRGSDSTVLLQRFRSERQILAGLQHPNIAALVDGGATEEGTPWLAMEYVDGVPIDEYCDKQSLDLASRLDLFRQVCAAVHFAHRNFVVHRDLKPSNVLVTPDGTVKLLDFGVAKLLDDERGEGTLTSAGLSPFTASYAAPEQITGAAISTATDVYSLGALLYTLLAGEPPLDSASLSPGELMDAIRDRPAIPPSEMVAKAASGDTGRGLTLARARGFPSAQRLIRALESELDAITLMALRKEPERRYGGADLLAEDVRRYLRRDRVHARPDTFGYRVRSLVRRQRPLALASAAAFVILVVGVGAVTWQQRQRASERLRAEQRLREVRTLVSALIYEANDQLADIPGATKARANLVRTAILALDRASADVPRDSTLLRELAMGYSRAGDALGNPTKPNLGDIEGAAGAYVKAVAMAEALMQHYPKDPASARTLSVVYERAADVEAPIGQLPKALEHQRASLAMARSLAAADSTRYEVIRAVGISALKTGDLLGHPSFTNAGDTSAAIGYYKESVALLERASAMGDSTTEGRRHRAIAYERLGRLMQERRDFAEAQRWLEVSLRLRDSIVAEAPRSVLARRDLAIAHYLVCGLHLAAGSAEFALPSCERSLLQRRALLSEDPGSSVLLRGMGIIYGRLGDVYAGIGDSTLSLDALTRAVNYYHRFFDGRAGAINDRRDYVQLQLKRAAVAGALPSINGAGIVTNAYQAAITSMDSIQKLAPLSARDSVMLLTATNGLKETGRKK